jgi:8-oxo-dGTP pyrophosphatase MutT (NUDIX family)
MAPANIYRPLKKFAKTQVLSATRLSKLRGRAPKLWHQTRNILAGDRGLVAKWVTLDLHQADFRPVKLSSRGQRIRTEYINNKKASGINLFNGDLVRTEFIPRDKGRHKNLKKIKIGVGSVKFFDYLGAVLDPKTRAILQSAGNRKRAQQNQVKLHNKVPYILACDSIVEIGNDGHGNPTHIIVLKRPSSVPIEPNVFDFPAGLVHLNDSPLETVRRRTSAELGISPDKKKLIGPGLKPTTKESIFALHCLGEGVLTYNGVIIERASSISADQARKIIQQNITLAREKNDKWAPSGFRLIPRNPQAISDFARKNPVVMPEVLRLYSRELQINSRTGIKK